MDIDYSVEYFDDAQLFGGPLGDVFTCSGPLQPDNQVGPGPGAGKILQGLEAAAKAGLLPGMPGQPGAGGNVGSMNASTLADIMGGTGTGTGSHSGTPPNAAPAQSTANAMAGTKPPTGQNAGTQPAANAMAGAKPPTGQNSGTQSMAEGVVPGAGHSGAGMTPRPAEFGQGGVPPGTPYKPQSGQYSPVPNAYSGGGSGGASPPSYQ